MDGNKLDLSGKPKADPAATYKVIPEADMEEDAVTRPKSLVKPKPASPEVDGADEKMLPKDEKVEVKISPNEKQNGDAKLDIGDLKTAFVGLTKEELMKYANDPFWVRLRWFLFITFWVLWGVMLLGAIMIICAAPKCEPPPPKTWWEKGPLVELDSAIDATEIATLKENGVTGVIVAWPEDTFAEVDENHQFVKTIKQYKDEGVNVIIEFEPGSSNVWFNQSENKDSEFADYYIWRSAKSDDNGKQEPPNNWLTFENKSSWIYSANRNQFYYSPKGRPHLNFRNPNVTEAFSSVIKKFVDFGVGGVRLKGVPFLLVNSSFEDEIPRSPNAAGFDLNNYGFYMHTKTENLLELGPLLKQWNVILKNLTENGPFMAAEHLRNIEAYKVNSSYVIDLPSQAHLFAKANTTVSDIINVLVSTFRSDNITWPSWKVNSSSEIEDIVTYLLPGTPLIKQNTAISKDLLKIRDTPSIMRGSFDFHSVNNGTVFAFIRVAPGNPGILVALNPTENRTVVDFPEAIKAVSEEVTVQLFSKNYNETDVAVNVKQKADKIPISPKSAIVLSYVPKSE